MPEYVSNTIAHITTELGKVIVGQTEPIEQILVALLAEGHALIEGVPGTAKTLTVRRFCGSFKPALGGFRFRPVLLLPALPARMASNMRPSNSSFEAGQIFPA